MTPAQPSAETVELRRLVDDVRRYLADGDVGRAIVRLRDAPTLAHSTPPASDANERAVAAQIAECAFDDRPRSRVGHPSQMDWEDGYRDGTRAAAAAIRRPQQPASDEGRG